MTFPKLRLKDMAVMARKNTDKRKNSWLNVSSEEKLILRLEADDIVFLLKIRHTSIPKPAMTPSAIIIAMIIKISISISLINISWNCFLVENNSKNKSNDCGGLKNKKKKKKKKNSTR